MTEDRLAQIKERAERVQQLTSIEIAKEMTSLEWQMALSVTAGQLADEVLELLAEGE